jgi:ABC-type Fe3+-hydroxamate transport system substrate-binding protein
MPFTDAIGTIHHTYHGARIVSLVPSITEMLCDFGLAGQLVGRTGFCIHPGEVVRSIPKVGGTKDVNIDKIRNLAPTHLVVNIDENEKPTVDKLAEFVPHIVVTHPITPRDNLELARLLGGIFGVEQAARDWSEAFDSALREERPSSDLCALYCIWKDPWMSVSAGTYIANMLGEIGWRVPALGEARYPAFTFMPELLEQVDLVLLSTEPYRFTQQHADELRREIGKPVLLVDGEMMSWYGTRALAGLRYLSGLAAMGPHALRA